MKLVLAVLLLLPSQVEAQTSLERYRVGTDSLYAAALEACLDAEFQAYSSMGFISDTATVYVEQPWSSSAALPKRLGSHPVVLLHADQARQFARAQGGLSVKRSFPIQVSGATLRVSFNNYEVEVERRFMRGTALAYTLWGGCHAAFSLSGGSFSLLGVELWGV